MLSILPPISGDLGCRLQQDRHTKSVCWRWPKRHSLPIPQISLSSTWNTLDIILTQSARFQYPFHTFTYPSPAPAPESLRGPGQLKPRNPPTRRSCTLQQAGSRSDGNLLASQIPHRSRRMPTTEAPRDGGPGWSILAESDVRRTRIIKANRCFPILFLPRSLAPK